MSPELEIESPQGRRTVLVGPDQGDWRLTDLLRRANLSLNTRCGQRGLCEGCSIELVGGSLMHRSTGQVVHAGGQPLTVHACEYRPTGEGVVRLSVPPRSLLAYEPQVVSEFRINVARAHDPLWQCLPVSAKELPAGGDELEAIVAAVTHRFDMHHAPRIDPEVRQGWRGLPGAQFHVTVEYRGDHWLITDVSDAPSAPPLGVAIDVGTTTVALLLVDLSSGTVVASAAGFNRQMHLGDDVVTRINLCSTDSSMLGRLQHAIVNDTIQRLLPKALKSANASDSQITCMTVAANTTMLHLLAGVDPSPMGLAPFTPRFLEHRVLPASAIHLHLSSLMVAVGEEDGRGPLESRPVATEAAEPVNAADPAIHLLPGAAAYVGADLTAGIFSSGLVYDDGPSLLVDVGTNGEIILKHGDHLWGCATAAGPAFEGARLTCGMRAGQGALSRIRMSRAAGAPHRRNDLPFRFRRWGHRRHSA